MNSGRSIRIAGAALCALLLAQAAPSPVSGQAFRYGAGWTVGGSKLTALNPDAGVGLSLEPDVGLLFGIHLERGYGDNARFVVRYQGTYLAPQIDWSAGDRRIDAVSADVSGLFRFFDPSEPYVVLPYLMAGAGGIWYDLGRGSATSYPLANAYHDGESRVLPLVTFGLGLDAPIGIDWFDAPVYVRGEFSDQMTFGSPLRRVSDRERYGAVHHLRFTIGAWGAVELIR